MRATVLVLATLVLSATGCRIDAQDPLRVDAPATAPIPTDAEVLTGDVRAAGAPIPNAIVTLRLYTIVKTDMVWSVSRATDASGRFRFGATDFPTRDLGAATGYAASITATANGYQSDTADLVVHRVAAIAPDTASPFLQATPRRVLLSLTRLDRGLYIFLLLPALAGFGLALLSLATTRITIWKSTFRYGEYHPALYALAAAGLWIFAVVRIVQAYVETGQEVVPIGPEGLTTPSSLIVATFLGSLTYVAYTVYVRGAEFFGPDHDDPRRELLLVVGGRVLVAPYVAAIAFGILSPAFPQLGTSAWVLFFGFFTGLWIKPVLEALNGIGKRLLSEESRTRVVEHMLAKERRERVPVTAGLLVQAGESVGLMTDRGDLSLAIDRSRLALRLRDSKAATQVGTELGLTPITTEPHDGFVVFSTGVTDVADYARLTTAATQHSGVVRVSSVFGPGGSQYSFATDRITLELKAPTAELPPTIRRVLDAQRGTAGKVQGTEYAVRIAPEIDPFTASAAFNAVPEVAFAEPDLTHVGGTSGMFEVQPVHGFTGDAGLAYRQIKAEAAWQIAGTKNVGLIRVAVLDNGVDVSHPDIKGCVVDKNGVVTKFDAFAGEGRAFPLAHDQHGSGCAGLAVADPPQRGMQGIGVGAKLLAARVSFTSGPGGKALMSNTTIRRGIAWAVAHGADVLCMSWSTSPSLAVEMEIEAAVTKGRGGLGCVIAVAAGNDGGPVAFPARLALVIAVAASDDKLALKRGPDWSSNFGPEVDVTAPGVPSFTTALNGAYQCLDGTSAAAAMVGGAAALVLRMNPTLTAKEVRDLLMATSDILPAGPAAPGSTIKLLDLEAAVKAASQ